MSCQREGISLVELKHMKDREIHHVKRPEKANRCREKIEKTFCDSVVRCVVIYSYLKTVNLQQV